MAALTHLTSCLCLFVLAKERSQMILAGLSLEARTSKATMHQAPLGCNVPVLEFVALKPLQCFPVHLFVILCSETVVSLLRPVDEGLLDLLQKYFIDFIHQQLEKGDSALLVPRQIIMDLLYTLVERWFIS